MDIRTWMDNWRLSSKNYVYSCWYPWIFGNSCMDMLRISGTTAYVLQTFGYIRYIRKPWHNSLVQATVKRRTSLIRSPVLAVNSCDYSKKYDTAGYITSIFQVLIHFLQSATPFLYQTLVTCGRIMQLWHDTLYHTWPRPRCESVWLVKEVWYGSTFYIYVAIYGNVRWRWYQTLAHRTE